MARLIKLAASKSPADPRHVIAVGIARRRPGSAPHAFALPLPCRRMLVGWAHGIECRTRCVGIATVCESAEAGTMAESMLVLCRGEACRWATKAAR